MSIDADNHCLRRVEYTATGHFPDGTELDLIRDAEGRPILAIREGKTGELCLTQQLTYREHIIFRPLREPAAWLRAMRLPNAINNEPAPLGELFDTLLSLFAPLDETQALLLASFACSTWWTDSKPAYAPLLLLSGAGATSILTRLEMVCRRGVVLTGTNNCGSFPAELRPTLLAKCDSRRFAAKFLKEQPWAGAPVWRAGNLVDAFTARVAALEAEADPLPGVLNLVIDQELPPAHIDADEIQAKLLGYRMANWNNLPPLDVPGDPLLATLLVGLYGEEELQSRLLEAYALNKGETDPKAEAEEERAVLTVLAGFIAIQQAWAYVAEIADGANTVLHKLGSSVALSPRRLGDILRRLGLETERNNRGRGLKFSAEAKQRIEELASRLQETHPAAQVAIS